MLDVVAPITITTLENAVALRVRMIRLTRLLRLHDALRSNTWGARAQLKYDYRCWRIVPKRLRRTAAAVARVQLRLSGEL